ncbi:MAG TPA: M36 family metallopeptidase, partial [Actinopolymorphaceae bacterium]
RKAATLSTKPEVRSLRTDLGVEGIVAIDGLTGTPRQVARTDGFLTAASKAGPETVVRSYLKANAAAFGLSAADVDRLKLRKAYQDIEGTHHLSFVQTVDGVTVFGHGVKAHVAKDGRLIAIGGSPVASLPTSVVAPQLTATQARSTAIRDVFGTPQPAATTTRDDAASTTTFVGGDLAQRVVFNAPGGLRSAWQTITSPSRSQMFLHVIDGRTGEVLYRRNLVQNDSAKVVDYYPGAPKGGTFRTVELPTRWLPANAPRLGGNVARVFSDVNDDDNPQGPEEIQRSGAQGFVFPFQRFLLPDADCQSFFCAWDATTARSWEKNRESSGAQLFYYLGKFHDHLEKHPIGFTREAGNFEAVDGDAVQGHDVDGADTADGKPDSNHVDNANMATPPDGQAPRMQMYLWRDPSVAGDPWVAAHGSYDASIVYHEYTHGLSNRLVVDADGNSTLGMVQAGAMGEGWSDWYAMDFLVRDGFVEDSPTAGEVRVGQYVAAGRDQIRFQPLDCPVGSTSSRCPGTETAGPGGFTYGDFGKVSESPQVHADGEIWSETLWDLRTRIGSTLAESLITRAMELSPANPSFLDMRHAILQADVVVNQGKAHKTIWQVFAGRGMGYFAGSIDGDDARPVESFALPPKPGSPTGTLTGTVASDAGRPVSGAVVAFGGHNFGFGGHYAAVTAADGTYVISGVYAGTYPKVFARGAGLDEGTATVAVRAGMNRKDWKLRRNWAATSGGSRVVDFSGGDASAFGCGPAALLDQSQAVGWSSDVVTSGNAMQPRFVVIRLPEAVDISTLSIDPSATCGDAGSASTGDYRVETSLDGKTWTRAASGHFGVADRGRMNAVPLAAGTTGVRYIRYTMLGTQVADSGGSCPGAFSGCEWVDSTELAVYGSAA